MALKTIRMLRLSMYLNEYDNTEHSNIIQISLRKINLVVQKERKCIVCILFLNNIPNLWSWFQMYRM